MITQVSCIKHYTQEEEEEEEDGIGLCSETPSRLVRTSIPLSSCKTLFTPLDVKWGEEKGPTGCSTNLLTRAYIYSDKKSLSFPDI